MMSGRGKLKKQGYFSVTLFTINKAQSPGTELGLHDEKTSSTPLTRLVFIQPLSIKLRDRVCKNTFRISFPKIAQYLPMPRY
jgi:hypothetical protein